MDVERTFQLSIDYAGRHYEGTVTPSEEKGANGMPVYFRVMLGEALFAYLCCGDNGWRQRDGNGQSRGLVDAIGSYIMDYYE